MRVEYSDVLAIIMSSITNTELHISDTPAWDEIIAILKKGKVLPIVYQTLAGIESCKAVPLEQLQDIQKITFKLGFRQLQSLYELRRVLMEADANDLQVTVFKGIVLANLYPEPSLRISSDADLLIPEAQRDKMEDMLLHLGYRKIENESKKHVPVYAVNNGQSSLTIELHDRLWEDYEGKQAEILKSLNLDNPNSFIRQNISMVPITTLGYNEHLIYQIFHIAKHFFFEGITFRYITDIALYINSFSEKIDFDFVRKNLQRLHYETIYDIIITICQKYLGMAKKAPIPKDVDEKVMNEFLDEVLAIREKDSVKNWETINFLSTYFMRTTGVKSSKFQQRRKQIFPLPSELNQKYHYAKKCPLLLPIAWIHRTIYFASYSRHCKKNGFTISASINKVQHRLDMMRRLDLTESDNINNSEK